MPFHVIIEVRAKELVEEQGLGGGTGTGTGTPNQKTNNSTVEREKGWTTCGKIQTSQNG